MTLEYPIAQRPIQPDQSGEVKELPGAWLGLMRDLEASLARSRRALVALDLAAIEAGTQEQRCLSQKLGGERPRGLSPQGIDPRGIDSREIDPEVRTPEMVQIENAVMQALRLHAALLSRAQRKLDVLRNTLAGPVWNYGPFLEHSARLEPGSTWKRGDWI